MKHIKIISLVLSIFIFLSSFLQYPIIVYANDNTSHGGGGHVRGDVVVDEKGVTIGSVLRDLGDLLTFGITEAGALANGDFEQFIKNQEDFLDYWNGTNVTVDEDTGNINFSKDLISYIKQALREYNEETNGFYLLSTPSIMELDPTLFSNINIYISLQNIINEYGIVSYYVSSDFMFVADVSSILDGTYNVTFGNISTTPFERPDLIFPLYLYNSYWEKYMYYNCTRIYFSGDNNQIFTEIPEKNGFTRELSYAGLLNINRKMATSSYLSIISKDGCRIRVFKSENAMKVYSVGERTVYFGTDFYEKEPTEITIKVDDFNKYLDTDFDKYFGQLKDTIISQGSNLSEQDIEKLTDSILGKLTDIDNNIGHVGDTVQESNNLLSQILAKLNNLDKNVSSILSNLDNKVSSTLDFSGIESRLDTIIESLEDITGLMNYNVNDEIEEKYNNFLDNAFNDFDEVGDLLTTKFPTSIPWDIANMLEMLRTGQTGYEDDSGGGDNESGGTSSGGGHGNTSSGVNSGTGSNNINHSVPSGLNNIIQDNKGSLVHTASLYKEDGTPLTYGYGAYISSSGAPVFCIPALFSQKMKIGGLLIIDLTGFEIIHDIGRVLFTLIFCMNLIHLTVKAVSLGKDVLT